VPQYRVAETPAPYTKPAGLYVLGPADAYALSIRMVGYRQEVFRALLLDSKHRLIRKVSICKGGLNAAVVHPREMFAPAITSRAAAIIMVHNHPSGNPEPSAEDLRLTRRMAEAGTLLGIEVLDHVIVAKGGYVSLREHYPPHGCHESPFDGGG